MKTEVKKIVAGVLVIGLGITAVILGLRNSKLTGENETLKKHLEDLNIICDNKDRYIGKILTELKKS